MNPRNPYDSFNYGRREEPKPRPQVKVMDKAPEEVSFTEEDKEFLAKMHIKE